MMEPRKYNRTGVIIGFMKKKKWNFLIAKLRKKKKKRKVSSFEEVKESKGKEGGTIGR